MADGVQPGRLTSFPQGVRLKADEVVVFARAGFESRAHRERVNKAAMADPRLADMTDPVSMPLGAGRVVLGGFESIVWSVAAP